MKEVRQPEYDSEHFRLELAIIIRQLTHLDVRHVILASKAVVQRQVV